MTTPRLTRRSLLLSTAALVASGCGGGRRTAGPTPDLVWAVGGVDGGPTGPAAATAAMWNDRHPNGPKVSIHVLPESADEQRQLMTIELSAGLRHFDILTLDVPWTGEFAANGWLADLGDVGSNIEKAALPALLPSARWKGKLWAAPFTTNAGFLYYRTDLVGTPPASWDELVRVGREAGRRAGITPFVGQGAQYEGMVVQYLELLWGAGGDLFSQGGGAVDFETGPALRALQFLSDARSTGFFAGDFATMTEEGARNAFQSGRAVFMRNWPYAYPAMSRAGSRVAGAFAIAPLPTFTGRGTISALGGQNLAVSRFSRSVDAARHFVEFASTTPAVQRTLAVRSVPPAMASVYGELGSEPVMALLGRVLPEARPRPSVAEWSAISDEIQQHIFPAYRGQGDPNRAIADVREFLELTVTEARASTG